MENPLLTREEILARLAQFKQQRKAEYDLTSLGIFGSYARGEANDNSDIDVVFETNSPNMFRSVRMKLELKNLLARSVDLVRLREPMNQRLKRRIVQDAEYV